MTSRSKKLEHIWFLIGLSDLIGRAGSEPTAAADPSWGGLGGPIYTLMIPLSNTTAYARYASDWKAPPLPPAPYRRALGFRVLGLGFRVLGFGFRV